MSRTYYFENMNLTSAVVADARLIISQAGRQGILLRDGLGVNKPVVDETKIFLNGDKATDQSWGSFLLTPAGKLGLPFCATGGRPYDPVVVAILLSGLLHTQVGFFGDDDLFNSQLFVSGVALYDTACGPITQEQIQIIETELV